MNVDAYYSPMRRAFTLVELLCTIAIIAILAALLLPVLEKGMGRARRASCANNLRNIGTAFSAWAHEHGDLYPMQVSTNQRGTREIALAATENFDSSFTYRHFQALSNELEVPRILRCPADKQRAEAQDFASLNNSHVSYWVNVDAVFGRTDSPVAGDRNVRTSGRTEWTFLQIASEHVVEFSSELHGYRGNVLFGDTHVGLYDGTNLTAVFASGSNTNTGDSTLSIPRPDSSSSSSSSGGSNAGANQNGTSTSPGTGEAGTTNSSGQSSQASSSGSANTPVRSRDSRSVRGARGGRNMGENDVAPIVYTKLDGTLATSAPPTRVTNSVSDHPMKEEILTPDHPLLELGQWISRQAARHTYWLLLLLAAILITLEIIRRRTRRDKRGIPTDD